MTFHFSVKVACLVSHKHNATHIVEMSSVLRFYPSISFDYSFDFLHKYTHILTDCFHRDTYLCIYFQEYIMLSTSKAWLAKSPHGALCSLPLGIVSNCIIHIGNLLPAAFSLILPHLPLRAKAGEEVEE